MLDSLINKIKNFGRDIGSGIDSAIDAAVKVFPSANKYVSNKLNQFVDQSVQPTFNKVEEFGHVTKGFLEDAIQKFSQWGLNTFPKPQQDESLLHYIASGEKELGKIGLDVAKGAISAPTMGLYNPKPKSVLGDLAIQGGKLAGLSPIYGKAFSAIEPLVSGKNLLTRAAADLLTGAAVTAATIPGTPKQRIETLKENIKDPLQIGLSLAFPIAKGNTLKGILDDSPQLNNKSLFNIEEEFLKYKGKNFDEYIAPYKDKVLEWARNKGIPEDIVHNKQVGEYLKNEFENLAKRKILNKKIQMLSGLNEEEVDRLLDTGASPTEIMAELRRQKKIRNTNRPVSIGKILGKYDPEQVAKRLKGKSIEELIDSEIPKNKKFNEEKAKFGSQNKFWSKKDKKKKLNMNEFVEYLPKLS